MKTGLDMITDAYIVINVPDITTEISGGVYPWERPKNSDKEDIVINGLPITADQQQRGVFNVNIHVPNLKGLEINGNSDDTIPDITRLKFITNLVVSKIQMVDGQDYSFSVATGGQLIKDSDLNWYMNLRVNYFALQTNYSNI